MPAPHHRWNLVNVGHLAWLKSSLDPHPACIGFTDQSPSWRRTSRNEPCVRVSREYRIVRYLMNQDLIARIAGENAGRKWYDELRPYYDWNGRYWDQRALFESRYGQHETARSYAERSIQVHRHSFGFNTLGTVLLRTAIRRGSTRELLEGIKNLYNAKDFAEWDSREHPFTTFFTSIIRYSQEYGIDSVPQEVKNAWASWFREAQSSRVFSTQQGQELLLNWQRQWLRFAVIS